MHWKGRNNNQCMGNTEFLWCGGLYFALAKSINYIGHSQLHVAATLMSMWTVTCRTGMQVQGNKVNILEFLQLWDFKAKICLSSLCYICRKKQ